MNVGYGAYVVIDLSGDGSHLGVAVALGDDHILNGGFLDLAQVDLDYAFAFAIADTFDDLFEEFLCCYFFSHNTML